MKWSFSLRVQGLDIKLTSTHTSIEQQVASFMVCKFVSNKLTLVCQNMNKLMQLNTLNNCHHCHVIFSTELFWATILVRNKKF